MKHDAHLVEGGQKDYWDGKITMNVTDRLAFMNDNLSTTACQETCCPNIYASLRSNHLDRTCSS
jgi:hypothetical protein